MPPDDSMPDPPSHQEVPVDRGVAPPVEPVSPAHPAPMAPPPMQPPLSAEVFDRWWTPLAVTGFSLLVFLVASGLMGLVGVLVVHGKLTPELLQDPEALIDVSRSRLGLFIVVVLPQFALVMPSIVAAMLSPVPVRRRLGLVKGHWPVWVWFAAALATPLVGMVSGLVVGLFLEESDTLRQMTEIFRDHGKNGFLIPLALMIGATPAICEELLFRGYVQTRLVRAFGPGIGITVASLLFAAFHMDFVHVVAVFPLGLFLGFIAWRSGSLFPAMLAHFVNNVVSVIAVVLSPEETPDVLALPAIGFTITVFGLGMFGLAIVIAATVAYGRPEDSTMGNGTSDLDELGHRNRPTV